ncbi:MAG TPA: hypothetical protein PKA64_25655, partial [Myxococcota bacterium]|nr:hypothetical protein [Myxococcota bacterium]
MLLLLLACQPQGELQVGAWSINPRDDGALDIAGEHARWSGVRLATAAAPAASAEMQLGAFRFAPVDPAFADVARFERTGDGIDAVLADGSSAALELADEGGALRLRWSPRCDPREGCPQERWLRFTADCEAGEPILGLGSHAMDVDHAGEAFPLWVSEPGIGKSDDDVQGTDWVLRGTRHASSYPVPFLLRPEQPTGALLDTIARVEVDLCAADPGRLSATAWGDAELVLLDGERPVDVVRALNARTGRPPLPPRWALGP